MPGYLPPVDSSRGTARIDRRAAFFRTTTRRDAYCLYAGPRLSVPGLRVLAVKLCQVPVETHCSRVAPKQKPMKKIIKRFFTMDEQ